MGRSTKKQLTGLVCTVLITSCLMGCKAKLPFKLPFELPDLSHITSPTTKQGSITDGLASLKRSGSDLAEPTIREAGVLTIGINTNLTSAPFVLSTLDGDTVKGYGYDVKFQNFTGYDEKLADIHGNTNKNQKKEKVLFKGRNIIVKRKEVNPQLKTVVFSARYDSYKDSVGALDNAGGVAALMEMARVLADTELQYNPEFVFFDSEHLRRGSRYYVASLSKEEKDNIYGVVNINSIGNKKQRKQMFFASKEDKSELKKQCEKYFSGIINYKSTETDASTFMAEKIPTLCHFTYDIFSSSKDIKAENYVREKDTSLVDMDTLVYDTAFITTYAYLLKVN